MFDGLNANKGHAFGKMHKISHFHKFLLLKMRKKRSVAPLGIVGEITQFKRQMARILFWKVVVV